MSLVIRNGRVIDPDSKTDKTADVVVEGDRVMQITEAGSGCGQSVVDAAGKWVLPGLVDLYASLREPGFEYKEDLQSAARAAAAGGFTTVVALPNTDPVADNAEVVDFVSRRGRGNELCRILPAGALTVGRLGQTLAPVGEMRRAGAVALSDGARSLNDGDLLRRAMEYSRDFNIPILLHCQDDTLARGGQMHEGSVSTRLGLLGAPRVAEDAAVERALLLAEYTGARLHLMHLSTRGAVEAVRRAKERGVLVTASVTAHHLALTHHAVEGYRTGAKLVPPLREEEDRMALLAAVADGTLDAVATDHAPQSVLEHDVAFADAQPGALGLQTALSVAYAATLEAGIPAVRLFRALTAVPASILDLDAGRLTPGGPADLMVWDPEKTWTLDDETNLSKSRNTPFWNESLQGRVELTLCSGKKVYPNPENPVS